MDTQPEIVRRDEQPYVAIRASVTMRTFGDVMPGLHPEVRDWLRSRGVAAAGAPFFRYRVIDMERQMQVEAGFPIATPLTGEDRVLAAVLPEGRYATLRHVGHPKGLVDATRTLLDWGARQGVTWDVTSAPEGQRWGCRLEIAYDEPGQDMDDWETELTFRLAD